MLGRALSCGVLPIVLILTSCHVSSRPSKLTLTHIQQEDALPIPYTVHMPESGHIVLYNVGILRKLGTGCSLQVISPTIENAVPSYLFADTCNFPKEGEKLCFEPLRLISPEGDAYVLSGCAPFSTLWLTDFAKNHLPNFPFGDYITIVRCVEFFHPRMAVCMSKTGHITVRSREPL